MMKQLARFIRVGQLPPGVRERLLSEGGVRYLDEGAPLTAVLQGYRAPGCFCGYRRMSLVGYLALSDLSLAVRAKFYHEASIQVPFDDPRFRAITFRLAGRRLEMAFAADGLIPGASGEVLLRMRVSDPVRLAELLRSRGAVFADVPPVAAG